MKRLPQIVTFFILASVWMGACSFPSPASSLSRNAVGQALTPTPTDPLLLPPPTAFNDLNYLEPVKDGNSDTSFENVAWATGSADFLNATEYKKSCIFVTYSPFGDRQPYLMLIGGVVTDPNEKLHGSPPAGAAFAPSEEGDCWIGVSNGANTNLYDWQTEADFSGMAASEVINGKVLSGSFIVSQNEIAPAFVTSSDVYAYLNDRWESLGHAGEVSGAEKAWLLSNQENSFLAVQKSGSPVVQIYRGKPDLSQLVLSGSVNAGVNIPIAMDVRKNVLVMAFVPDRQHLLYAEFGPDARNTSFLVQNVLEGGAIEDAAILLTNDLNNALILWVHRKVRNNPASEFPFLVRSVVFRQPAKLAVYPGVYPPGVGENISFPSVIATTEIKAVRNIWVRRSFDNYDYLFATLYYPNAAGVYSLFSLHLGVDNYIQGVLSGKSETEGVNWSDALNRDGTKQ